MSRPNPIRPVLLLAAFALAGFDNGITGGVIAHPDFGPMFFPHMGREGGTSDVFCKCVLADRRPRYICITIQS